MPIATLEDLIPLLPNLTTERSEWHCSCPFCKPEPNERIIENSDGIKFTGEDRMFIRMRDLSIYCRRCGRHTLEQLIKLLGKEASDTLKTSTHAVEPEKRALKLLKTTEVVGAAAMVDRAYWKKFGWDDDTITHFKLGRYVMYSDDGFAHVIPMQPRTAITPPEQGWMLEGRVFPQPKNRKIKTKRTMGSSRDYFWHIHDDEASKTVVVVEGGKDGISSWVIGYKNVAVAFGTSVWFQEKTTFLRQEGYDTIIVIGDNDAAGREFSEKVVTQANNIGLTAHSMIWEPTFDPSFDLTNLLEKLGVAGARHYVDTHLGLITPEPPTQSAYVPNLKDIDPDFHQHTDADTLTLDTIRGKGPQSMRKAIDKYLTGYKKRKRGDGGLMLLKAPPGSGKSYTLIQVAQEIAKVRYTQKRYERQRLEELIVAEEKRLIEEDFEEGEDADLLRQLIFRLKDDLENFSMASVMWLSQFKVSYDDIIKHGENVTWDGYWYDYKARNDENCGKIELVNAMGAANHDIGAYCHTACPLRELCKKNGYLSQEKERRKYPITVFRHQHIGASWYADYPDLVVIDESPLHTMQSPILVKNKHLYPHSDGWALHVTDSEQVELIELFANGLRQAMVTNRETDDPDVIISGAAFLSLVDKSIQGNSEGKWTLSKLYRKINIDIVEQDYQPNQHEDSVKSVKPRMLHTVYYAIGKELVNWEVDQANLFPSNLHLMGQTLEVYEKEALKVPKKLPIIIADATAHMPELYEKIFDRPIIATYAPEVRNPNAKTIVVTGSDNTVSRTQKNLGKLIATRKKNELANIKTVTDVAGETLSLDTINWVDTRYDNKLFNYYVSVIEYLIKKHESLLVIATKEVRLLLEDYVNGIKPDYRERVQFNHYGNVRGTNRYAGVQSVLLVGQFRIPYNALWREVQSWGQFLGIKESIPMEFTFRAKGYDTRQDGHSYRTFSHPFAQKYVDALEEAEMQQSAERIRPHATDSDKFIYLLASRPSLNWITDVTTEAQLKGSAIETGAIRQLMNAMMARLSTGNTLTQTEAVEKYGATTNLYTQARAALEIELGFKLPTGRPKKDAK